MNQLKQIGLASHHYALNHTDRFPGLPSPGGPPPYFNGYLEEISPYLEVFSSGQAGSELRYVKLFISPADPSVQFRPHSATSTDLGNTSYAPNAFALEHSPTNLDISDGTSQTLLFAEHYARCGDEIETQFSYAASPTSWSPTQLRGLTRLNAFAYRFHGLQDVYPITSPTGTSSSRADLTFQVAPHTSVCDSTIPQTVVAHVG
jgi:hypothetical protein